MQDLYQQPWHGTTFQGRGLCQVDWQRVMSHLRFEAKSTHASESGAVWCLTTNTTVDNIGSLR